MCKSNIDKARIGTSCYVQIATIFFCIEVDKCNHVTDVLIVNKLLLCGPIEPKNNNLVQQFRLPLTGHVTCNAAYSGILLTLVIVVLLATVYDLAIRPITINSWAPEESYHSTIEGM